MINFKGAVNFFFIHGAYSTQSKYENQWSKFQGDMSTRSWSFLGHHLMLLPVWAGPPVMTLAEK